MYEQIKKLADEAIVLQNKNRMDAVLREISVRCERAMQADTGSIDLLPLADTGALMPDADAAPREALAAAQPGDTVQLAGISDGAGNERILDMTPALPLAGASIAAATKYSEEVVKPAKKGGGKNA